MLIFFIFLFFIFPDLTGWGNYWRREAIGEEIRSWPLTQDVYEFLGASGVSPRSPTQCFAKGGIDDVHFTTQTKKLFSTSVRDRDRERERERE